MRDSVGGGLGGEEACWKTGNGRDDAKDVETGDGTHDDMLVGDGEHGDSVLDMFS